MSRQQKRANERKKHKTAFQKLCLAAGEGVGKAMAFSFALASHAGAAEPKKEEPITLPPVVVQDQNSPYVVPNPHCRSSRCRSQDTPQSITIVPQKLVEEQAGTTLRDALRNVPGITATAGEGGGAQGDVFHVTRIQRAQRYVSSMACATPAPIFAIHSISNPSKF